MDVSTRINTQVKRVITGRPVRRINQASETSIYNIRGISVAGVADGDMLIYNESNAQFEVTKQIDNDQNVNGGQY